jgi:hypothetical protein
MAVQVDPIKPKLKPPGTKRLKLSWDILLSTSAFNFNLRRFTMGNPNLYNMVRTTIQKDGWQVGAYTRPLFGSA